MRRMTKVSRTRPTGVTPVGWLFASDLSASERRIEAWNKSNSAFPIFNGEDFAFFSGGKETVSGQSARGDVGEKRRG